MPQTYKRKRSWSRAVFSNLQRKGLEKRFPVGVGCSWGWQQYGVLGSMLAGGNVSSAERDWGQEEKGTREDEMAGWHHCAPGVAAAAPGPAAGVHGGIRAPVRLHGRPAPLPVIWEPLLSINEGLDSYAVFD